MIICQDQQNAEPPEAATPLRSLDPKSYYYGKHWKA